jgi:ATP-dependent Clp protease protease subunit
MTKASKISRRTKDTDNLYENHIDIKNRRVFLFGEIDEDTAGLAIKSLLMLDETEGPITIMINSPGGCVDSGWGLTDTLTGLKNEITGIVVGAAASMGSMVLQGCDIRKMTKNSSILIHNASYNLQKPGSALKTWAKFDKEEERKTIEIFAARTKLSPSRLKQLFDAETIFNSEESLKYGLVDEIV